MTPRAVLHPAREPAEVLEAIRQNIGSGPFSAQYLQRPVPDEGNLIKWKWFPRYEKPPSFGAGDRIVQSWDTASKVTELADYSVCTTWHQLREDFYLLEVLRVKLEYPQLKRAVIQQGLKWRARTILIEVQKIIPQYGIELVDVRIKRLDYVESVREKVYVGMISERKWIAAQFRSKDEGRSAETLGTMEKELRQIRSTAYRRVQAVQCQADAEATII